VTNSINRGIVTQRSWATTCAIGSSIYKDLKLKKEEEEELLIGGLRVTCEASLRSLPAKRIRKAYPQSV
jgi:hypothetical protein